MTVPYGGIDFYRTTIDLPEDDDEPTGALFADPLSKLQDSVTFLGIRKDEIEDNLRNHAHATGSGGIGTFATLAGTLTDVSGIAATVTPKVGDKVRFVVDLSVVSTGGSQAQFRVRYSSASVSATVVEGGNKLVNVTANGTSVTLVGYITAAFNEATTFQLQATYVSVSGIVITNSWTISVECLRAGY